MEIIHESVNEHIECDKKEQPGGWEEALTSEEFLQETRKMLKKKFDERLPQMGAFQIVDL
jgi:hypothetical protein